LPLARIGWVGGSWSQQLARGRQHVPSTGTWGSGGDGSINRVLQGRGAGAEGL
jgi:hypothetical protein